METGYPLASNSLYLAKGDAPCRALTTENLLARVPSLLRGLGQEGMLTRNRYHLLSGPLRCQLAQPPLPFEWPAMRKLGFLAKPVRESLALDRLEK